MKQIIVMLFLILYGSMTVQAKEIAVSVNKVTNSGVGDSIGVILAKDSPDGLVLQPYLQGLTPGQYGFSVNENVGCGAHFYADGSTVAGMAAGKSLSTLPVLKFNSQGQASQTMLIRHLTLNQIRGRTLVLYEGKEDVRIACGSLELYGPGG